MFRAQAPQPSHPLISQPVSPLLTHSLILTISSVSPLSLSESPLSVSSPLPVFLTFYPSHSPPFLPMAFSLQSLACPPFFLTLFPFLPPAHSPGPAFPSTQTPGVEKSEGREARTPSMGKPQPSDSSCPSFSQLMRVILCKVAFKEPMESSFLGTQYQRESLNMGHAWPPPHPGCPLILGPLFNPLPSQARPWEGPAWCHCPMRGCSGSQGCWPCRGCPRAWPSGGRPSMTPKPSWLSWSTATVSASSSRGE